MKNKLLAALLGFLLISEFSFAQQTKLENAFMIFKGGVLVTTGTTYSLPEGVVFKIDGTSSFSTVNISNFIAQGNIILGTNWLSGDGGNEGIYIDSSGRVGIGTNLPTTVLDVNGAVTVRYVQTNLGQVVVTSPSSDGIINIRNSTSSQILRIDQNSLRTTTSSDITLFTNTRTNQLVLKQSSGFVGIGTNLPASTLDVNGNLTVRGPQTNKTDSATALVIQNTAGDTNTLVVDTINSRVGIGTNIPAVKLTVLEQSTNTMNIEVLRLISEVLTDIKDTSVGCIGLHLLDAGKTSNELARITWEPLAGSETVGGMSLWSNPGGDPVKRLSIVSSGFVGIGTNLPASTLDVNGNLTVRGVQTNLGNVVMSGNLSVAGTSYIYYASTTNYIARWSTGVGEYYVQACSNGTLSSIVTNTMVW